MTPAAPDPDPDVRSGALGALVDLTSDLCDLEGLLARFSEIASSEIAFDDCVAVLPAPQEGTPVAYALRRRRDGAAIEEPRIESMPAPLAELEAIACSTGPTLIDDVDSDGPARELRTLLRGRGNRSALCMGLGAATGTPALLILASGRPASFTSKDAVFLRRAARLLSLACHDRLRLAPREPTADEDLGFWQTLLEVNNAVTGTLDPEELRTSIADGVRRFVDYDQISVFLFDATGERIEVFSLASGVPLEVSGALASIRIEDTPFAEAKTLHDAVVCEPHQMTFMPEEIRSEALFRSWKRFCLLPLRTPRRTLGAISLASRSDGAFPREAVWRASQAANQVAIAIENALAFREIATLRDRLAQENLYLEEEIRGRHEFEEIVGESRALQSVLAQVRNVADTDSTVLLLGETGTGKELLARAIHRLSSRRSRTLVAVNCAASPASLLESEWFGYEKGAFTGALARKAGRFELADGGTLFLDEVGDIPLELQAKLLRVLQEREIERLGTTRPVRVDFRLIAATNVDLQATVNEKKFRSDLYYRLNVFPIRIPPLRERREDIPPLVTAFTRRYAQRLKRAVDSVPRETMEALCRWPWPGNVRELQNVIERAVILSPGRSLQIPATEFTAPAPVGGTLESAERDHILRSLIDTKWVVGGPNGAAARLGLKRTTLVSTMKRLGIERPEDR